MSGSVNIFAQSRLALSRGLGPIRSVHGLRRKAFLLSASTRMRLASRETAFIRMPSSGPDQTQFHDCFCFRKKV